MINNRLGKPIENNLKAVLFARDENAGIDTVTKQLEICENFATFFDYEVIGVATEIDTLFNTNVEYDAVIVTSYGRISRNALEFESIKRKLLDKGIIIITAVRA